MRSDSRGCRRSASNRPGRGACCCSALRVSCAPCRIQKPTRLSTAPSTNGTRQPQPFICPSLSVSTNKVATPEATSCPMVVDTYWKLENSPRRPGPADSTRKVVEAANSPPTDRPCNSRARTRTTGASTPTEA